MDQLWTTFESADNKLNLSILIAVLVVLFSIVIYWFKTRTTSKAKSILIVGLSNSGKTTLYCQLVFKKILLTQTSILPNKKEDLKFEKTTTTKEKSFDIVDVPGNDKVRRRFFDLTKRGAKAILLVVDGSTFQQNQKDVAQFLYEILTDEHCSKANIKVLVACNKQDLDFAKGETLIRTTLEKEIELLRKISSSALKSTNETKQMSNTIQVKSGCEEQAFEFKDLKYLKFDFKEIISSDLENVNKNVVNWIQTRL